MADEVHELTVKVSPEGVDETQDGLDDVSDSFEDSADRTGDAAGSMDDMAEAITGSAAAVVAGLTTVAAGLLSQVPVIGEAMSGLGAILDAITFKLDEKLRPVFGPITSALFDLADAIHRSDSAFSLLSVGIGPITAGLLEIVERIPGVIEWLGNLANGAIETANTWAEKIDEMVSDIADFATNTADIIREFNVTGRTLFQLFWAAVQTGFETLFDLIIDGAKGMANRFVGIIESAVNRAIRATPELIRSQLNLQTVSIDRPFETRGAEAITQAGQARFQQRAEEIVGGGAVGDFENQLQQLIIALQNNTQEVNLNLEGRNVARVARELLGEETLAQGRTAGR